MTSQKVDGYTSMKFPVATYKRGSKKQPRVFKIDELDGFYVDNELNRAVHVTFDDNDVFVIDIFDSAQAAYTDTGKTVGIIEVNIKNGKAKFFTEDR